MPDIRVELHSHSYRSKDSLMLPARMLAVCERGGIDRLAITDHNTIAGALEAASLHPSRVIIGEEIKTTKGELLAFFLRKEVPGGLDPRQAIDLLREQGAFISVSHPLDPWRSGAWRETDLREILPLVDALEVFNSRSLIAGADLRAAALALQAGLLQTAGSDAHAYFELGRSGMQLPEFAGPQEFRIALQQGEIIERRSPPWVHFLSMYASLRKGLGWKARHSMSGRA